MWFKVFLIFNKVQSNFKSNYMINMFLSEEFLLKKRVALYSLQKYFFDWSLKIIFNHEIVIVDTKWTK